MSNVTEFSRHEREQTLNELTQELTEAGTTGGSRGNGPPPTSGDWPGWRVSVDARLEALKGAIDGTRWVVGIVAVIMIGGFSFLGFQLNRLEGRVDRIEAAIQAIPVRLSDEFARNALGNGSTDQRYRQFDHRHSPSATTSATDYRAAGAATSSKTGQTPIGMRTWKSSRL